MADTDQTKCSCLEVFGEDPDCPLHGMDGLEARIAEKDARIAKLEATIANSDYAHLISIIADIRMKSGVGANPMLSELADAIADRISASRAECEGLLETDYFGGLVARAMWSATKASAKFPQPNYVTLKIAEEAGEVVRGAVHYAENRMEWDEVEGEIVQLLAMLIRFVTEGDQINGITPPVRASLSQKETGDE